jgi:prepilin-type N-terminal cleavage/methylation domain-containing protein
MLKSKLNKLKESEGFTIIEVIIVLVVAAIIMLIVFLVVPQLQNSQRNTRRQNDARRILTAGEQFAANNNGTVPACAANLTLTGTGTTACANITNITGDILTPLNGNYTTSAAAPAAVDQIYIGPGACNATGATGAATYGTPANSLIVVVRQEPAGTFCLARQ